MDVVPTIRTTRQNAARVFPERLRVLRGMPYVEYLQTPEWRKRRDRALHLAGWRCHRCQKKHDLQVHHRTYERLGEEHDDDLEVLCVGCHEGHHFDESRQTHLGVYVKLVSDALKGQTFESLSDLTEAVKTHCARLKIQYDYGAVARAIASLNDERIRLQAPKRYAPPPRPIDDAPIGKEEATEICRRLGIKVPFKSVPAVSRRTVHPDKLRAARMVMGEIVETVYRCELLEREVEKS